MKPDQPAIDVAQLMERVRRNVEEKRKAGIYKDDGWAGSLRYGSGIAAPGDQLALLRTSARVDLEGEAIQSHRPVAGALIVALKRFSRYWVRKYTDPLFLRQGTFNSEAVNAVTALQREVEELKSELDRLKARLEEPERREKQ